MRPSDAPRADPPAAPRAGRRIAGVFAAPVPATDPRAVPDRRAPARRVLAARVAALGVLAWLVLAGPARAAERWPLWPSEVSRAAEALRPAAGEPRLTTEAHKLQALRALERYPTALVGALLVEALQDGTGTVRREALHACLERRLVTCVPAAVALWNADGPDPGVRIAAMRVIGLDAGEVPAHADLLLAALREQDEATRAETAHTLARVAWSEGQVPRVRTALIGKLGDTAPAVRRAAARSLGLLGPRLGDAGARTDPAPLALARLLADPDPQVRGDAAEALGALRDPRAAPPLIRAIEAGDEPFVSRAYVLALGGIPGPEVDAALIRLLDAPPRGLTYRQVGEALGRRPDPSPAVIDALVARLREDSLQVYVLEALLLQGDAAAPALRAALDRGLEPQLELAVRRLLAALAVPAAATDARAPWPAAADAPGWHARLAGPDGLPAAAALARADPPWLGAAAAGALAREHGAAQRRPWLLALAAAGRPPVPAADRPTAARLAGWAADADLAALDRCLALAALARGTAAPRDAVAAAVERAATDPRPAVRACAAVELRDDVLLAGLLRDAAPRVRATAGFAVAACPVRPSAATQAIVAELAVRDPHPGVQRAARAALARLTDRDPPPCRWHLRDVDEPRPGADAVAAGWVDVDWRGQPLRLPVEPLGDRRWLLLPTADELVPTLPGR